MNISILINDFMKQNIQSEAEVRSKLIVPLLELLGYPMDFRAEEFPVYGYEGSKPLKSKAADFLQFDSNEFDTHRGKSNPEIEWVYEHSLLVFEAKKPTEKVLVTGQPVFYSAWTKSVAYMISNGIDIKGYIVNANYTDTCVFSCKVKEIPQNWDDINRLNYNQVLQLKQTACQNGTWTTRGIYEDYKNAMLVQCNEILNICCDRNLEEIPYDFNIKDSTKKRKFDELLDDSCKIITSEPGGGKSFFMWMLMREYLTRYTSDDERIPVLLEGRYYGRSYVSIVDGIYQELQMFSALMTKEMVDKRLRDGGFVILFDALDEVEIDCDILVRTLHQLKRSTDNIIIVTSRIQNYREEFRNNFTHYSLEPLDDDKITALLKQYSHGNMDISINQIPRRLLEIIRTPLFLKMFVAISRNETKYRIPSNHAALFEAYISQKMKEMSCSLLDETVIKSVLAKYALHSIENGDNTEEFFEILKQNCDKVDLTTIYNKIWKTGLISKGLQGIKFYHKALQEFFAALKLSTFDEINLTNWLEQNAFDEKYDEVICYLTRILSNQSKQAFVLDYLESHNLKLYIRALKSRRNFSMTETTLDYQYAQKYFAQIMKTYETIIQVFFNRINHVFDGYSIDGSKKLCISGNINFSKKTISMAIYGGNQEAKTLDISISSKQQIQMLTSDGRDISISSSVFTIGNRHERFYNLELLSYGFDSAREIAVDIIKKQIKDATEKQTMFDIDLDVLLVERTEKMLKNFRNKHHISKSERDKFSLYANDFESIIHKISESGIRDSETEAIFIFCNLLKNKMDTAQDFLDVPPDLKLEVGKTSCWFDELYSNTQLVKKINRILVLSNEAIRKISLEYVPVLGFSTSRKIGIVYRQGRCSGVRYINVKSTADEDTSPIIEFRKKEIDTYPVLDSYYINQLEKINKTESDVVGSCSSALSIYFGDNVFHNLIYGEVKDLFKKLFGKF